MLGVIFAGVGRGPDPMAIRVEVNPSYGLICVAAGEHPECRIVCVMDFAYPPGH